MLREDVRLRQGVAATLKRIKNLGLRMAVATTTRRANIEIYCRQNQNILNEIQLDEVFEYFVCAEDVRNIKPDPECYFRAMEYLGLPREDLCRRGLAFRSGSGYACGPCLHRHPRGKLGAGCRRDQSSYSALL